MIWPSCCRRQQKSTSSPALRYSGSKSADLLERPFVKSHVAAGNVLGNDIGQEHVVWSSGRRGDAGLDPVLGGRRDVRPANPRVISAEQRADHKIEPFRIGHTIAVGIGDDFACRGSGADIASCAEARIFLPNVDDPGMSRGDLLRVVLRSIIHENHFVIGIFECVAAIRGTDRGFSRHCRSRQSRKPLDSVGSLTLRVIEPSLAKSSFTVE